MVHLFYGRVPSAPMRADRDPSQRYPIRRDVPRQRRLRMTPGRLAVALAMVGSLGLLFYGLVRRDSAQIPILASGLIILGLALLGAGLWSALAAYRDARHGRSGWAFVGALFGGLCGLGGSGGRASAPPLPLLFYTPQPPP